jgi:hypothetical protein
MTRCLAQPPCFCEAIHTMRAKPLLSAADGVPARKGAANRASTTWRWPALKTRHMTKIIAAIRQWIYLSCLFYRGAIDPPRCHRRPGFKPIGTRMYDQIVRRMVPGHWYSRGDLTRAAGFGMDARGYLMRSLLAGSLATRAPNPASGTGTSTRPAPQWLYRLTAKGEALRDLCRLLA